MVKDVLVIINLFFKVHFQQLFPQEYGKNERNQQITSFKQVFGWNYLVIFLYFLIKGKKSFLLRIHNFVRVGYKMPVLTQVVTLRHAADLSLGNYRSQNVPWSIEIDIMKVLRMSLTMLKLKYYFIILPQKSFIHI